MRPPGQRRHSVEEELWKSCGRLKLLSKKFFSQKFWKRKILVKALQTRAAILRTKLSIRDALLEALGLRLYSRLSRHSARDALSSSKFSGALRQLRSRHHFGDFEIRTRCSLKETSLSAFSERQILRTAKNVVVRQFAVRTSHRIGLEHDSFRRFVLEDFRGFLFFEGFSLKNSRAENVRKRDSSKRFEPECREEACNSKRKLRSSKKKFD